MGMGMKKHHCLLVVALILFSLPAHCDAQSFPGGNLPSSFFPIPGYSFYFGENTFTCQVKAGYERLDFRFNVPIPEVPPFFGLEIVFPSSVNFKMKDANVWIGAVEFELQMGETYGAFINAEGAASKRVDVSDQQDPFGLPVEWKGSKLEWWSIEGGGFYNLRKDCAFVGGLRRSRLSLKLHDPSDQLGLYQGFLQTGFNDLYSADLLTNMWIPYIGIRVNGNNYRAELLYSPVSFADVTLPFRYRFDIAVPTFGGPFAFQEERYSMNRLGTFLEASMDYHMNWTSSVALGLWIKGTYMNIRGKGYEDSTRQGPESLVPGFSGSGSANACASLNISAIAGGISCLLSF